jgi:hypothetical protein
MHSYELLSALLADDALLFLRTLIAGNPLPDHSLSRMLGVKPVYYGHELMQASVEVDASKDYRLKSSFKAVLSPILAAGMETQVSNRAEVQRFFGKAKFAMIEEGMKTTGLRRLAGPAFAPCFMRNVRVNNEPTYFFDFFFGIN